MGIVFGKTGVAEPAYDILLSRDPPATSLGYEIRRYGTRFAIETEYAGEDAGSAFRILAGYIGVGQAPQNDSSQTIAMTAPVVTDAATSEKKQGKPIAMTAPVVTKVKEEEGDNPPKKTMQFILPAEYDDLSKIPKPTNPKVAVCEVPSAVGATHQFNGWVKEEKARGKVTALVKALNKDGLDMQEADAHQKSLLWQYHPPFTIPNLRRNEVWIELNDDQVNVLVKKFPSETKDDTS